MILFTIISNDSFSSLQMSSVACSVLNCINSKVGTPNKQFHFYPKNEELCRIWIEKTNPYLQDKPFGCVRGYLVCTDHFESSDYATPLRLKLNRGAVPKLKLPQFRFLNGTFSPLSRFLSTVFFSFSVDRKEEKVICQRIDDVYCTDIRFDA